MIIRKTLLALLYFMSITICAQSNILPVYKCNSPVLQYNSDSIDQYSKEELVCIILDKLESGSYQDVETELKFLNKSRIAAARAAKYDNAIFYTSLMAHAWLKVDSMHLYSFRLSTLAYYKYRLGDIMDCYQTALVAYDIAVKTDYIRGQDSALDRLAWVNWRIKRYEEAIKVNERRKKLVFGSLHDDFKKYTWYNSSATFHSYYGDYETGYMHGDSALYFAKKQGKSSSIAMALSNLGNYFEGSDSLAFRIKSVREALIINEQNKNIEQLGANSGLLGELLLLAKDYSDAEDQFKTSLQISEKIGDRPRVRIAYEGLSALYDSIGDYKKALLFHKEGKKLDEKLYGINNIEKVFDLEKMIFERENEQLKDEQEINDLRISQQRTKIQLLSILFLAIALAIWLYFRSKIKNQRRNRQRMEELHQSKLNSLEIQSLRSQMNPHFIFNSLNSIKGFISTNEPRVATRFLNKFSKLIRMILSHSKQKMISLKEEIEALNLYIELENLRLSNVLEYNITIKDDVDIETIQIPPLIIQPFVENAIWHGLSLSKRTKLLDIVIQKEGDYIAIKVIDNGIGREASTNRQSQKDTNHKSYGIDITKGRIALSNKKKTSNTDDKVYFNDLILADGSPGGTEVTIQIKP